MSLVIISLERNNLRKINGEGFSGLTRVKELNLEVNNLEQFPNGALSKRIIYFGENLHKEIPENALIGNKNLTMVNIPHYPMYINLS